MRLLILYKNFLFVLYKKKIFLLLPLGGNSFWKWCCLRKRSSVKPKQASSFVLVELTSLVCCLSRSSSFLRLALNGCSLQQGRLVNAGGFLHVSLWDPESGFPHGWDPAVRGALALGKGSTLKLLPAGLRSPPCLCRLYPKSSPWLLSKIQYPVKVISDLKCPWMRTGCYCAMLPVYLCA